MIQAVTADDMVAIVQAQVKKAKEGDQKALEYVTDYLLGAGQSVTLVQNNYTTVPADQSQRDTVLELHRKGLSPLQIGARLSMESATVVSIIEASEKGA